jgi:hypothetical protein
MGVELRQTLQQVQQAEIPAQQAKIPAMPAIM